MEIRFGVDDGRKEMMRVADLLDKYGFKGIFYIAPFEQKCDILVKDIQELSRRHEVAGHTLTHPRLTRISLEQAKHEIEMGKEELEDYIGKPITKFATPRGYYNPDIIELIKQAGYTEHRDTLMGYTAREEDDFHLHCSAHLYPRPEYKEKGIYQSIIDKFEEAKAGGGYFNVILHTDELTKYKLWQVFEYVLAYIKANK